MPFTVIEVSSTISETIPRHLPRDFFHLKNFDF